MRVAVHIPFYYVESRLDYLHRVLDALAGIPHSLAAFVYTNREFNLEKRCSGLSVSLMPVNFRRLPIFHDQMMMFLPYGLRRRYDPLFLTWACRRGMERMADDFDAQMYLEDDISFTKEAFSYWLDYKDLCLAHRYNLGFVRYEVGGDKLLCTDLTQKPVTTLHLGECAFLVNDSNPYCGMWIYDRKELAEFMKSPEWKYAPSRAYDIRARCAVGWHGVDMKRYKASIIPLHDLDADTMEVDCRCRLHHMPNNYIGHRAFCTIEFPLRAGKRHMDERTQGVRIKG